MTHVVMQIGMMQVYVLSPGLLMLDQYLAVFIFGNPTLGREIEGSTIATNQVIKANPITLSA